MVMSRDAVRSSVCILLFLFTSSIASANSAVTQDNAILLKALSSGNHFALLRHALAPGNGDPRQFELKNCATQRNLNEVGRNQARAIGELLRTAGIDKAQAYSSQWCRCMETARLLGMGQIEELAVLNSFYEKPRNRDNQTQALRSWLSELSYEQPIILVTHQVNITALTGVFVASGELVVVKRLPNSELKVIGTIKTATQ